MSEKDIKLISYNITKHRQQEINHYRGNYFIYINKYNMYECIMVTQVLARNCQSFILTVDC